VLVLILVLGKINLDLSLCYSIDLTR